MINQKIPTTRWCNSMVFYASVSNLTLKITCSTEWFLPIVHWLRYLWSEMYFFSLFLCVFLAACLTCLHLRDISLLIMSALPLNYVLWLFWFHFTSCLDPILSISDWMLQIVSLTMDNCPIICSKHVLPHAKQIKCCSCHLIYHMKCLTLQTEDLFIYPKQFTYVVL